MRESTVHFEGLRVAAFESRRANEMAGFIEKHGGIPFVAPSMREVAIEHNQAAIDFANRLLTGEVDLFIATTGVGFRFLLRSIERHVKRELFLQTLSDITTLARGPKVVAAMREVDLTPSRRIPAPHTWREILAVIDTLPSALGQVVGVQEYGLSNASLTAGLEARGAHVLSVPVYQWDLPEDVGPLENNVSALCRGDIDVVLFTSARQVAHLALIAEKLGCSDELNRATQRIVIASVGPATSDAIQAQGWKVDLEPEHPKMGPLVAIAAARSKPILKQKQKPVTTATQLSSDAPPPDAWRDSPFMKACRLEPTDVTPVWLMRQAGRYMAEYRAVRKRVPFLELCKNPALCSEVMCTAVKRLGVDAAIIFSDLLPMLEPMGLELTYAPGDGPVIHNPIRTALDVDRVDELEDVSALAFVMETVKQTRQDLPPQLPLIGFAGAPFTLASYAIEGGASRNYLNTKTLMYSDPGAWRSLMERLARAITIYLNGQIANGAQAVQIFDSWAGCLAPEDYRNYVLPYVQQVISGLEPGVPVINFATGNPALLPLLADTEAAVIGVDWRTQLDHAWQTTGFNRAVQGNLEPAVLLTDVATIRKRAQHVLNQAGGRPGHIFNLGHGILQQTPVDHAIALVDAVHEFSSR
ncbi:MAG: uroporphyrinogen decarboxylase [Planctomycetaceae bacterium]|nr:uroporphyrinogen decarboxylase [Planctomycetaceae bacterium]